MSFLEMSVMGGIMALVITVLRAVFLNKLPKRTFVFLWEIAMLRLLLPLSVPAITSVYTLFAKPQTAPPGNAGITVINAPTIINAVPAGAFQAAAEPLQENASSAVPVWTIVWGAGAILSFFTFLLGYILVYRKYRYATIVKDGYPTEWLAKQKLIRKVRIYRSEQTLSPLTYGIFRPVILLPENTDTEKSEQLDFILTHELTHIKRFDMLRKITAAAVLCLHWFNPAVWVLFGLYNRDIEIACDEAVVRKAGGDCRSAYAMALIGMEERQRGFSSLFSHFSKNAAQERIVAIMKTKKLGVFTGVAACMLAVGVTCSFATSAAEERSDKNAVSVTKQNDFTVIEEKPGAIISGVSMAAWYDSQRDGKGPVVYGKEWVKQYEPFGITLDENGYMMYGGERIRYFLDGITTENGSHTFQYTYEEPSGTVDVRAERELEYNSDGTRIGFGKILLVEKSSPEQFAAKEFSFNIWGGSTIKIDGWEKSAGINDEQENGFQYIYQGYSPKTKYNSFSEDVDIHVPDVEWWTYDEYKAWLEEEKIGLQGMLGEKGWTGGRGDFVWTQEMIDETIAMYEDILEQIKNGVKVSKSVDGDTDVMLMQTFPAGQTSEMIADEMNKAAKMSKDEVLEKFGKYGISFDGNDQMLYNGELVRFFCGGCEIDGGWAISNSFYNEKGKIDVYAIYEKTDNGDGSFDSMGKLVGLRKASEEEFENLKFGYDDSFAETVTEGVTVIPSTFDIDKNSYEISISDVVTEAILVEGTADNIYAVSDKKEESTAEGNSAVTVFVK